MRLSQAEGFAELRVISYIATDKDRSPETTGEAVAESLVDIGHHK